MKLTPQQKIAIIDAVIHRIEKKSYRTICYQLRLETINQTGIVLWIPGIVDEFGLAEFKPEDKNNTDIWFPINKDGQMMRLGILVHVKSKINGAI